MTKQKETDKGNPKDAYMLSRDLLKAFINSDAYTNAKTNKYFVFDILVGVGEFTAEVLKGLCVASHRGNEIYDFYVNELLPHAFKEMGDFFENLEALTSVLGEMEEKLKAS